MPADARHWQDAFATMLRDPAAAAPPGVLATARRLDVHRATVHTTLVDCLAARFPVVRRLLGEECFAQTALDFVRARPPASPALVFYGGGFAAFLEDCTPLGGYPWLGDIARLEWARHEAFNGADAEPCDVSVLATLDPERLMLTRLSLHPTVRLVASRHPVWSIWRTNAEDDEVRAVTAAAESVLVVRPDWAVIVEPLPPGGFALVSALAKGDALGEAATAAHEAAGADADVTSTLALLIRTRAMIAVG